MSQLRPGCLSQMLRELRQVSEPVRVPLGLRGARYTVVAAATLGALLTCPAARSVPYRECQAAGSAAGPVPHHSHLQPGAGIHMRLHQRGGQTPLLRRSQ
ncbi:hypothetical protein NDU88_001184 [Pleurodeles waltl]|uniref:Uncharacterized protein n=1 Tax=Pleurodeles waltl TaxID=8319 RepID=A0AAV7LKN4_PLEWA|nr:hypothetical protein NDU88_001184 [Pleurodeles waltl]